MNKQEKPYVEPEMSERTEVPLSESTKERQWPHEGVGYQIGHLTVDYATNEKRSGYTGVYQNKKNGKWAAQITFKNKTYYLGSYEKIEDAVKARRRGEEMHDDFLEWYYQQHGQNDRTKE